MIDNFPHNREVSVNLSVSFACAFCYVSCVDFETSTSSTNHKESSCPKSNDCKGLHGVGLDTKLRGRKYSCCSVLTKLNEDVAPSSNRITFGPFIGIGTNVGWVFDFVTNFQFQVLDIN